MHSCGSVDKLGRNADSAGRQFETTLQHVGNTQFLADLAHVDGLDGVDLDGVAGNYLQPFGPCQVRDQVFGEGIGEARFSRLATQVVEGQHRHR